MSNHQLKVIAKIKSSFPTKFGIPRQSGLINTLKSKIIFEPEYRNPDAIRGLEGFSHIWLIWEFSQNKESFSLTVRPPRLGGNKRVGVFATRSPFRPNPIGLSCVEIESIEATEDYGTVINIIGADLLDGTPIYDIKPYLPHIDSKPNARGGFAHQVENYELEVDFPDKIKNGLSLQFVETVTEILKSDPRPSYHNDPERIYGFQYEEYEIKFSVDKEKLKVVNIKKAEPIV